MSFCSAEVVVDNDVSIAVFHPPGVLERGLSELAAAVSAAVRSVKGSTRQALLPEVRFAVFLEAILASTSMTIWVIPRPL